MNKKLFFLLLLCPCLLNAQIVRGKLLFQRAYASAEQRMIKRAPSATYIASATKLVLIPLERLAPATAAAARTNSTFLCNSLDRFPQAISTITNSDGYYYFRYVPVGSYVLRVCGSSGQYVVQVTSRDRPYKLMPDLAVSSN